MIWNAIRPAVLVGALMMSQGTLAQIQQPLASSPPDSGPPPTAEAGALLDLTGFWVSVVTEDWRWRMLTPAKGDYSGVPLNSAGLKVADTFDPALYGGATDTGVRGGGGFEEGPLVKVPIGRYQVSGIIDCRAYGAAGLMRMPTRLHITWASPNELQIDSDWGEQTRLLQFVPGRPYATAAEQMLNAGHGPASPQGYSVAAWEQPYEPGALYYQRGPVRSRRPGRGVRAPEPGGSLAVVTTNLSPGWLRRNGVPYGSHTRMVEHYLIFGGPTGGRWFDVTTEVIDPEYLNAPFVTSSDFEQEPNGSKWDPQPCKKVTAGN
jgi:hypothetical protein